VGLDDRKADAGREREKACQRNVFPRNRKKEGLEITGPIN
jgi:hypothetical protein